MLSFDAESSEVQIKWETETLEELKGMKEQIAFLIDLLYF